ncbi:hypothetical protein GQ43DRAFT_214227 [Delitschia confertaspora ATCC 74209]|uniref:UDENN FLCN/SMCR8-type domain-containing protein n=1 Tax=Delitschia confertaspora ATCC 74209 TaxID=1513339 RepID=A0A9P4MNU1_9PLEO|nr:hypothetical protein GQ43DRAFT_214227 [Delitschia confertaspora ATCC 74209]
MGQISLAHFCESHGPTFIFCTEASYSPCTICNPCVTPPNEETPRSSCSYNGLYDQQSMRLAERLPQFSSPFETPPTSPRSPTSPQSSYFPSFGSSCDGNMSGRRPSSTFDSAIDTVCDNCSFVVPQKTNGGLPTPCVSSPSKHARGRDSCPVLRTSKKVAVWGPRPQCSAFPGSPESSDMSDSEQPPCSPTLAPPGTHNHTLNYISSGQAQSADKYSLLRRSSIRTLSCEMLPTGKSSGPMLFGDPVAGYTIAYIFRLQDPRARGQKRTYALLALAGKDARRANRAMVKITTVFEKIANEIVTLADKVLERESRPATAIPGNPPLSVPNFSSPQKERALSSVASAPASRNITPVSSFLTAKKVDPDGYPRVSRDMMDAKPLTEIVGKDNFFVELHSLFCGILAGLIKDFSR